MEQYLRIYFVPGSFEVYDYEIVTFETDKEHEAYHDDPYHFLHPAADFLVDENLATTLTRMAADLKKETGTTPN